jgi:hypothetical protein
MTTNEQELRERLVAIIEKEVWGLVCECGGGGTDNNNETCKHCKGTGIRDWKYGFALDKLLALIRTEKAEAFERVLAKVKRHDSPFSIGQHAWNDCYNKFTKAIKEDAK